MAEDDKHAAAAQAADASIKGEPATANEEEKTVYEGRRAALDSVWRWLAAILTLGIAAFVWWLQAIGLRVRITNQRVVTKVGVFSIRTDFFELYRVNDIVVEEPLSERMLGYGRIVLVSSDRSDNKLELRGLKHPEAIADKIRAAVEVQKRARRVATVSEA